MLLKVPRAENSGWNLTGETNHRAGIKAESVFSSCKRIWRQIGLLLPLRTSSQRFWHKSSCRTSRRWRVWMTNCSVFSGFEHKKVHAKTQINAPIHALSVSPDSFLALSQLKKKKPKKQQSAQKEWTAFCLGAARVGLDQSTSAWFAAQALIQNLFIKSQIKPACLTC